MLSVRILIVDDNETVRRGLRSFLSSRTDFLICGEAADGLDAVEKSKALQPDVVLMDITMPRMSGLEATRIIRREVPDSKIIIISQNDPSIIHRQALEVGAAGSVAKADVSRDLIPMVENLCQRNTEIAANRTSQKGHAPDPLLPEGSVSLESKFGTERKSKRWRNERSCST